MVPLQIFGCTFVLIIVANNIIQGYGYSVDMNTRETNELVFYTSFCYNTERKNFFVLLVKLYISCLIYVYMYLYVFIKMQ